MEVTTDLEASDDDESADSSRPRCSVCGSLLSMVTVIGPDEAIASPCGCHAPPDILESS
ncbi:MULTISPECIES: hypothetical protein [Natronorubrum]|uniref:Small CPxCG-related zinc finger protein n=1 Tax=Natronorubrum bangense JCM 10635 TaxID=1227500 RepID=L9WRS6_9EURY|nr:hypothetical protein [Natronorubrum bangense]ELY52194.1 hypothetical protein C494_01522 [Natronorubrum bangense JCM 10635]